MNLSFLQPIYGYAAPNASVYLNVSKDAADADHAIRVRWGKAREELLAQGADERSVRALDEVIGRSEGEPGPRGQLAFAAEGGVLFDLLVPEPPQDYGVRVGELPNPAPYLIQRGQHVPYVLAVVDSIGADLTAVDARGSTRTERVEGEEHPTHKPRGGAEHHKQMQRAVDEKIGHNAKRVADAIQRHAVPGETELIVIAGETPIQGEVIGRLSEGWRPKAVEIEGGSRAPGSENSALETELGERLRERADQQIRDVAEAYHEGRGNEDRVTEGLAAVVAALQRGQVATLLWTPGALTGEERVWIGPSAEQIGMTEEEVRGIGATEPVRERADAAIIRAAAGTSADLLFVPEEKAAPDEGLAALLRFPDPTLPT